MSILLEIEAPTKAINHPDTIFLYIVNVYTFNVYYDMYNTTRYSPCIYLMDEIYSLVNICFRRLYTNNIYQGQKKYTRLYIYIYMYIKIVYIH